jgi:hypothetical protein
LIGWWKSDFHVRMVRHTAALLLLTTGSCVAGDLSGFTRSHGSAVRHAVPPGSSLGAGRALVVFAGASAIPAGLTSAVATSTGSLSLANDGDTVRLGNRSGAIVDSFTYPSSPASSDGVSMNRSPDGSTGSFVLHDTLSSSASTSDSRPSDTFFHRQEIQ